MRRTSETDAFSASRMRTPLGPSRTSWSLHRVVSTSDVRLSPADTPESDSESARRAVQVRPRLAAEGRSGVDLRARGPCVVLPVKARRAEPENAFHRIEHLQAINPQAVSRRLFGILHPRTVSPSVHPRPASGGAANFFLASALRLHQVLRPEGEKDARCVRPISATQT